MRNALIAFATLGVFAWAGPATARHIGAGEHTHCRTKDVHAKHKDARAEEKKGCAHWGAHHHHGIHLEGSH